MLMPTFETMPCRSFSFGAGFVFIGGGPLQELGFFFFFLISVTFFLSYSFIKYLTS